MRAIVLAAGRGKRLTPYTANRPKCLLPIGQRSILERQIQTMRELGIDDITVVKGYAADSIDLPGLRYYVNPDYTTTNMVYSLFCAEAELAGDVVISYADVLFESRVLGSLLSVEPRDVAVVGDTMWREYYGARFDDPFEEAESFVYDARGRISQIGATHPDPSQVYARYIGLIRLSDAGCSAFRATFHRARERFWDKEWQRGRIFQQSYMTDFLQALIDEGIPVHCVPVARGWLEFDSAKDYEMVLQWHRSGAVNRFCAVEH